MTRDYDYARQRGLTLLELSVVLLVLIALAGLAIPYVGGTGRMAMCQATDATLKAVKEAILGGATAPGFYGDMLGYYPKVTKSATADFNLHFLFSAPVDNSWGAMTDYNPKTAIGWHGPYLMTGINAPAGLDGSFSDVFDASTNLNGKVHVAIDAAAGSQVMDAWGRPIVLQIPYDGAAFDYGYARLVSAGPGTGIGPGEAALDTQTQTLDASDRGDDRVLYLRRSDPGSNVTCDET
ncbi:MAG: hypothetical protein ACU83N_14770 [Gammaproteobacteria bacterium]